MLALVGCLLTCVRLAADSSPDPFAPVAPAINDERILKIMPNYQTVNDPNSRIVRMTARQKWTLGFKESIDLFNIANVAIASGFSQIGDQTPKYGEGGAAYGMRFGAAFGDFATQNLFSAGLLATLLHQDPRYFRKGPGAGVLKRVGYSLSRLAIARQDSGATAFNASGVFGMALGIAASNLYYPSESVRGWVMLGRVQTSLLGGAIGNLTSEFWPDIQKKFRRRSHETVSPKEN